MGVVVMKDITIKGKDAKRLQQFVEDYRAGQYPSSTVDKICFWVDVYIPAPELGPCPLCGGECLIDETDTLFCAAVHCPYNGGSREVIIEAHNRLSRQAGAIKEVAELARSEIGKGGVGYTLGEILRRFDLLTRDDESEGA